MLLQRGRNILTVVKKSYDEINEKIKKGKAVVLTAEEIIPMVAEQGIKKTLKEVDVVTTATFGPMCSSGVFFNFGHSNPPIRMKKVWLNNVPAYAGIAAVDAYLGATEESENNGANYGGAHVIEDLLEGRPVKLRALGTGTDCYPNKMVEGYINLNDVNEAILFNPRNAYQNYVAATNSSVDTIYTYMGILLPKYGNVTYSTAGQLSPLLNDPNLRTIGPGTKIFLGGTQGLIAWSGTQCNTLREKNEHGVPIGPGATLSVIGDLKKMDSRYLKAAIYQGYGVSLFVGIGIPIPVLDEDMLRCLAIKDEDISTYIYDYGVCTNRPTVAKVTYGQLKSGHVNINGKKVLTAPLSSLVRAREIADTLKKEIINGNFLLQEPVMKIFSENPIKPMTFKEV